MLNPDRDDKVTITVPADVSLNSTLVSVGNFSFGGGELVVDLRRATLPRGRNTIVLFRYDAAVDAVPAYNTTVLVDPRCYNLTGEAPILDFFAANEWRVTFTVEHLDVEGCAHFLRTEPPLTPPPPPCVVGGLECWLLGVILGAIVYILLLVAVAVAVAQRRKRAKAKRAAENDAAFSSFTASTATPRSEYELIQLPNPLSLSAAGYEMPTDSFAADSAGRVAPVRPQIYDAVNVRAMRPDDASNSSIGTVSLRLPAPESAYDE
ncbi:MAG: hypothetical protein IV100_15650 [Myxococcales bacterium]|nr:hypothetical protein [Myxococcales bacterium]